MKIYDKGETLNGIPERIRKRFAFSDWLTKTEACFPRLTLRVTK